MRLGGRARRVLPFFWAASFLWTAVVSAAVKSAPPVSVTLPSKVSVLGPAYTVGDVAEVVGRDGVQVERIRRTPVGRAPLPGHPVTLTAVSLRVALRKAGFADADFVVPDGEAEVATARQEYPLKTLLPVVREQVVRATGEDPANVKLEPSEAFNKVVTLPRGKVTASLRPPLSGRYEGMTLFTAELLVEGRKVRTLPLRCGIRIERPYVVVKRRIERGAKLDASRLELKRVSVGQTGPEPVTDLSVAIGRTAARALVPGQVLRIADIADPPVVHRGQEVTCRVRRGNVEMEARVRVLEDGKAGSVIRVENIGSKKTFKARVLSEDAVESLGGPSGSK